MNQPTNDFGIPENTSRLVTFPGRGRVNKCVNVSGGSLPLMG